MSQSPDHDDGSQRSVAELIARYGGSAPSGGRRHRRASGADETAPRAAVPDEVTPVAAAAVEASRTPTPSRPSPPAAYPGSPRSHPAAGGDLFTAWGDDNGSRTEQLPRIDPGPVASPSPAPVPPRPPARRAARPRGPHRGEPPAGLNGSQPPAEGSDTRGSAVQRLRAVPPIADEPRPDEPRPDEPRPDEPRPGEARPEEAAGSAATGVAAGARDGGHTGDGEPGSAVREWAVVAGQVGGGVLGGAMLWLACEWLWQSIPVLALIVALAVITGLVWVVRRVRRAEDLQTTVVAVLVGLFVTVSPAALLLVGR